jgi:hypothetical protein
VSRPKREHDYDGPLDILALDLRTRRALAWASSCIKAEHYGCGAAAYTPCLYEGKPWHPYRDVRSTRPEDQITTIFPFHRARWHAASKINPLIALAIASREGGPLDPNEP